MEKTMDQRLLFLGDFADYIKSGRFYLAQQKMKTPVFFDGFKGENEYFTKDMQENFAKSYRT